MDAMLALLLALAQEHGAGQDARDRTDAATLDRIVVTARRRDETLQDVPAAVTTASGEELESRGAGDIGGLGALTPNMTIYPARAFNGTVTAFIRGIGQADPFWGVEPGVGVYIDDVYFARPQAALLDLLDIERIEVLRGPQGTLYGKNTLGGTIKVITRKPDAERSASAALTLGAFGRRDEKLVLNLPASDTLHARLAFAKFDRDGYGHNLLTGEDVSARDAGVMRLGASWLPRPDIDVRLALDRYLDRSGTQGFKRLAVNPFDPARTPPDPGNFDVRNGAPNVQDLDSTGASLTIDWTLAPGHRLRSISAYRSGGSYALVDFDTLPIQLNTLERIFAEHQASQELQWLRSGPRTQVVAGVYWSDGATGGTGYNYGRSPPYAATTGNVATRSLAVYGNLTRSLGQAFSLDLGLRLTRERRIGSAFVRSYLDATHTVPTGVVNADFTKSKTFQDASPRINLSWNANSDLLLYSQASRGFKSGTFNTRANTRVFPASADPIEDESVTSFELGAKQQWQGGRITLNAAAFHNRYRDIQLSVFTPYDSNGDGVDDALFGDFRNAGDGTIRGFELEGAAQLGRVLRVQGDVGYLDARYDHYIDGGVDVADRKRFSNAPRLTSGASASIDLPLPRHGWMTARIDGRYQSKVYQTPDLSELMAQGGYALWNASVAWISPQQHWRLTLRGNNLGDKAYRVTGFSLPTLGIITGQYGAPRTWAITIDYDF